MTADVIAVSYLDWGHVVSLVYIRERFVWGSFLTSMIAVFSGSDLPEDLKSLARDSRVTNSRSDSDIVDIVRAEV